MSESKSNTSGLTFQYAGAAISVVAAVLFSIATLARLFQMWVGGGLVSFLLPGYTGTVTFAILAVLFAVLAFLLYRKVTKEVAAEPSYIEKPIYNFITNSLVAVLALLSILFVAEMVSVLISSLLLIGTSTDIGALYLGTFLPNLVFLALVSFVAYCAYKIMKGKNVSGIMTLVLLSVAGAIMLAVLITVPIKAHSSTNNSTDQYNLERYFEDLY